jgi:predicted nucleic acid-binding protein
MILVDTNYLLAQINPRDTLYKRAQAWATALSEPLVVTEYVLWELVNAYSMPRDRPKAHAAVSHLRSGKDCELVSATPELFTAGLKLHAQSTDKEWSLTDCISFIVMRRRNIARALTFDHHFEQAGFEALLRRDPS